MEQLETGLTAAADRAALARILSLALATLCALFLLDAAVFRSGFYVRWLEPASAAGSFETIFRMSRKTRYGRAHTTLILGDSQIAEGFSSELADQMGAPAGWEFLNAGFGGASMRTWYFMLRDLDPGRSRFDVIVLPLHGYPDIDYVDYPANADREPDLRYIIAHQKLADLPQLVASFPRLETRIGILREALFEGLVYRRDMREFLRSPRARVEHIKECLRACGDSIYTYPGQTGDLSGLWMDWASYTLHAPSNIDPAREAEMKNQTDFRNWSVRGYERAFRNEWLGTIISRYRGTHTRILIICLPYRPFPIPLSWPVDSGSFIVDAAGNPHVTIAAEDLFTDLQRPDYFFDVFHMNKKGRELFSKRLAHLIIE